MGKKVFSLCMALALCLGLLPVTALAAEGAPNTLYVGNQNVKSGEDTTYWATTDNGELKLVVSPPTILMIGPKYDPNTATPRLKNATIKTTHDGSDLCYDLEVGGVTDHPIGRRKHNSVRFGLLWNLCGCRNVK